MQPLSGFGLSAVFLLIFPVFFSLQPLKLRLKSSTINLSNTTEDPLKLRHPRPRFSPQFSLGTAVHSVVKLRLEKQPKSAPSRADPNSQKTRHHVFHVSPGHKLLSVIPG